MKWYGVMPAITTEFTPDLRVDHEALGRHVTLMIDSGCTGVVALGSLGEGATLRHEEKIDVLRTCVRAVAGRAPVVSAVSALSTADAVQIAKDAADAGCSGLMVLPPYVYSTDWREMKTHVAAVFRATHLSCMLYNNPIAYTTDFLPEHIAELASGHANFHAVKESSADVRRVTAIRSLCGDRLAVFVGVDDLIVEGIHAGAVGWIAGLANALPEESVRLFDLASTNDSGVHDLYRWFLPLLRMDTVPKFVQLIKLVQERVGNGTARVRPPRLELMGIEREDALRTIQIALGTRPQTDGKA